MKKDFTQFNDNDLYFVPLGGAGEVGMNLNLYYHQDQWLMVDLGITFSDRLGVEILTPDTSFIERHRDKLVGLVLTHGHEDHIGAVPHLWRRLKCPIYATPFTMNLVKAKLREAGLLESAALHTIELQSKWDIGSFNVELINITHSIPEANMVLIRTAAGSVLHTGDWKLDSNPVVGNLSNTERIRSLAQENIMAMLCDSTNVFEPGSSGSEMAVQQNLRKCIEEYPDSRIVVACFASNVARIHSCAAVAQQTGRQLGLVGRSLMRIDSAARQEGYLQEFPKFMNDRTIMNQPRSKALLMCTGSQGEKRSALYKIANNDHPSIKLDEGDVVIFSSRVIPGNEEDINAVQNLLIERGIILIPDYQHDVHVSGHPCQDELKQVYDWVKPKAAIPVHGEMRHLAHHAELARSWGVPATFVPHNGDVIKINGAKGPEKVGMVHHGRFAVDGKSLVNWNGKMLQDRKLLGEQGVFVMTLVSHGSSSGKKYVIKFASSGLFETAEQQKQVIEDCTDLLKQILSRYRTNPNIDHMKQEIHKMISNHIRHLYGKHPLILLQLL